jgi:hypothetical protein
LLGGSAPIHTLSEKTALAEIISIEIFTTTTIKQMNFE